jgi:ribosomal protein S18 acetylase RimI-like enzyme
VPGNQCVDLPMTEQSPEIIRISIKDADILRTISVKTFTETFAGQNTESDMQQYIAKKLSIETLSAELNNAGSEFYFISCGNEIMGYLKLNSGNAQTENSNANSLEIERIYVLNKCHGKGLGYLLLKKAIEIGREKQHSYIWLGVWEKNTKAIAFYQKNGFAVYDKHLFILGNDQQTDLMMKLELN